MSVLDTYASKVLEPLSEATDTLLKPLDIMPNDYLLLGVNADATKFVAKVCTLREAKLDDRATVICPDEVERAIDMWSPSYDARYKTFERIPEKTEILGPNKESINKWELAATDFTVLVLHHCWPSSQVVMGEQAKVLYQYILMRFLGQSASSNIIARYKVEGHVPDMPEDYIEHPNPNLRLSDYQKVALMASLDQSGYALFMEQGTGKTPVVVNRINLEGFRKRRDEGKMYLSLVVCPKQVRKNWHKEFERFSTRMGKVSTLRGGQFRRMRCLNDGIMYDESCNFAVCIVSMDSIPSIWDYVKIVPWDLIVYDESHTSKNPQSRRFKHFKEFARWSHIKQRTNLTGTPIANTVMDLWAQWEMLGEGLSGFLEFKTYKKYHGKYQKQDLEEGGSINRLVGIKNIPLVQERLARQSFLITKEEAKIQLPDKTYDYAEVDMTKEQGTIYKKIATELIHEIENDLESKKLTTDHILTKMLRLAQITSGHITWDKDIDPETLELSGGFTEQISEINPKVNYLMDEITDENRDPNGKMIIWCCFIEDIRIISQALSERGINHVGYHATINSDYKVKGAEEAEDKINLVDDCRIFLANPASAGTGLNLLGYDRDNPADSTMYVDREIFVSCNWSFIIRDQGESRGHRRDARAPGVRITDLIVPDTIDEEIRERLKAKKKMAMEVQDIRSILRKLI